MSEQPKLSALVVARNEGAQLDACLSTLIFVDEIVVVLDRSTDDSKAIALKYAAKIVEGAWDLEGPRRQAGEEACTGAWVLEVDADERVPTALAGEIKNLLVIKEKTAFDWYRIPFDNYIGNRLVRNGWGANFGVGAKAILYKRGVKSWGAQRVHPKVKMGGACGGMLDNRMKHYVDRDISDMLQRLDRYTTLHAADLRGSGNAETFGHNVLRIFGRFWKCYVLRKGYKEGGLGFVIAVCAALYPILSYLKAVEAEENNI